MPILRLQRQTASFPRIGKLRKGAKKPTAGNAPGKDLSFFRFDSDDADAVQHFSAVYGNEPKQVNIYLPFDTVDENFQTWQEEYSAGGLKHRCDGETCVIWQKPDGTYSQEPKPCPGNCKAVGRLNVIIPELARLAYVTAETHSVHDILTLTDNLQASLALRGSLTGIPFVLSRRPKEISMADKDGKRKRFTKYLLFLEPHPDWVRVQLAAMRHNALTFAGAGLALPEHRQLTDGGAVDLGTGEIIDHEDDDNELDEAHIEQPVSTTNGNGKSATFKRFMALGTELFNGQWDDARHWLIERYTTKMTPSNVRKSTNDLADGEIAALVSALSEMGSTYQAKWRKFLAEQAPTVQVEQIDEDDAGLWEDATEQAIAEAVTA